MRMRPTSEPTLNSDDDDLNSDESALSLTAERTSSTTYLLPQDEHKGKAQQLSKKGLAAFGLFLLSLILLSQLGPQEKPSRQPASHVFEGQSLNAILSKAMQKALGGGIGGAVAGVCQVLALMWLRTAMNYQYRHGGGLRNALVVLYAQGGVRRFYQGVGFALLQTPLSRFGDTATNVGVLSLFAALAPGVPLGVRTACASASGSLWRILITPFDTCKTTMQVEGPAAYDLLVRKARAEGVGTLWNGAIGNAVASFVGSYPWFFTFNLMDELLPKASKAQVIYRLTRSAAMGLIATGVSDVTSNSVRVIKTTRQTSAVQLSYLGAVQLVVSADGWQGLLCRGLGTRLLANALQSALFAIVWKAIEAELNGTAR